MEVSTNKFKVDFIKIVVKEFMGEIFDEIDRLPIAEQCHYNVISDGRKLINAIEHSSSREVGVKKFKYDQIRDYYLNMREICILSTLNHENIVKLLEICCNVGKNISKYCIFR